jgi:DNA polymerase
MPWTPEQAAMLIELGLPPVQRHAQVGGWGAKARQTPAAVARNPLAAPSGDRAGVAVSPQPQPVPVVRPEADACAAPVAQMDWPALQQAVSTCTACGLCRTRTHTVFGVGSAQAQWMVVGEAPGEQEDLRGEPFVGAAGRLLDQMLRAVGCSRGPWPDAQPPSPAQRVYIANALKCRPPGNRNPAPEEMSRCEPFLQRQIALLGPRLIVAMGRFAVQSLLRSNEPIGRLRGRVHQYAGVPLVVTYHPAYLLRNPLDKAKAWDDWCLAASTFEALA